MSSPAGVAQAHHVHLFSFQAVCGSLEASTATHPPTRESETRPGAPTETLPRGPRMAQELRPVQCLQSSREEDGPDLAGAGRCQLFLYLWLLGWDAVVPGGMGTPRAEFRDSSASCPQHPRGETGCGVSLTGVWIFSSVLLRAPKSWFHQHPWFSIPSPAMLEGCLCLSIYLCTLLSSFIHSFKNKM